MFEQDRVVMRLQQRVNLDSDVLVCFVAGSHGRGDSDAYSDLDVALVYGDARGRDAAWSRRRDLVQSMLPFVSAKSFDATHVRPYFHVALYSNGAKVDYRFESTESLLPNPWDRDIRILKDHDDWGRQFQEACSRTSRTQPQLSSGELAEIDDRFWIMFWDVFRLLLRGDHDKPFTIYLELLQFTLPALLLVLPEEDPARTGLLRLDYGPDTRMSLRHMAQLLDAYLVAREAIVARQKLHFVPDRRFESAIRRLVEQLAQ